MWVPTVEEGHLGGGGTDRVKEYMCERGAIRRGGLDQARRECLGQGEVETFLPWPHP